MRFVDPLPVTCPSCSTESAQRVADLLSLAATCPHCSASLKDTGLKMRASVDNWSAFCTWAQISIEVEDQLSVTIDDSDVFKEKKSTASLTLDDLAELVRRHLPPNSHEAQRSRELVVEAARKVLGENVGLEMLGLPILEAVHPARWENVR